MQYGVNYKIIGAFAKTELILIRLVEPGMGVHYFHGQVEHLSPSFKVVLQTLVPTDSKQHTLATVEYNTFTNECVVTPAVLQFDMLQSVVGVASGEYFLVGLFDAADTFSLHHIVNRFIDTDSEQPLTLIITEYITRIIFYIFNLYASRNTVENVVL